MRRYKPGNSCCGLIGFDENIWVNVVSCFPGMSPIINLASDVSQLTRCKLVFGGNINSCSNAVRFSFGDWPAVATYVAGGGRLWINAEHSGDFISVGNPAHEIIKCLQDMANLNSFLSAIGSTLSYVGNDYIINIGCTVSDVGDANIADSISFSADRFGEVTGGTTVIISTNPRYTNDVSFVGSPRSIVVVEKVGNGFVFLCGDSNWPNCSGNCTFVQRLLNYADADII